MKLENKPTVQEGRAVPANPQPLTPHAVGARRPDRSRINAIDLIDAVGTR